MKEMKVLFDNNRIWVKESLLKDPEYFTKHVKEQKPKYLWIGCSDSRVSANQILGMEAGELFVHRNVANLCVHTDFNFLSVLEYAVTVLQVEHIIVCGHYGCGGIQAALEKETYGLVDNWLRNIRDIAQLNCSELKSIPSPEGKSRRLVELNVFAQVKNVCHTSIVQKAWGSGKHLCVHGWVYDLADGFLTDLETTYSEINQINFRYRMI